MQTISDRIVEVIQKSGVTRGQFAAAIEITPAAVTKICAGENSPSRQTIALICTKFGISRKWLETGEGRMDLPDLSERSAVELLLGEEMQPLPKLIYSILSGYNELTPENKAVIDELIQKHVFEKKD